MKTIFWGLLITWIHFDLDLGAMSFQFLPAAVGWYFVLQGMRELPPCAARDAAEGPVKALIGLSAVHWCMEVFGGLGVLGSTVGLMALCVQIYVLHLLIGLIATVEMMVSHAMPVANLRRGWKIWTVCILLSYVLEPTLGVPLFAIFTAFFAAMAALTAFIAFIYLLMQFWNAVKAYEEAMAHPIEILPPEEE